MSLWVQKEKDSIWERLESLQHLGASQRAAIRWLSIRESDTILDLACWKPGLMKRITGHLRVRACGVCRSDDTLDRARRLQPEEDVLACQGERLPFRDCYFDAVVSAGAMPSVTREQLLELLRVMKPGAQLVISYSLLRGNPRPSGIMPIRRMRAMKTLEENGFHRVSWRSVGLCGVIMAWKANQAA